MPVVQLWGSGQVRREFLYVDDMAAACLHLMQLNQTTLERFIEPRCRHINIGTGADISIFELAQIVQQCVGFTGDIAFDASMPDGAPRKLLDISKMTQLGWQAKVNLYEGVRLTYQWMLQHQDNLRG